MSDWYRRLWQPAGAGYRLASACLSPAEAAYRAAINARGWAYDRGWLRARGVPIPTLAVGNLTVGGTGKTPLTAWLAGRLAEGALRPAVILRGYGGDEVAVHRILNPGVPVHTSGNRVAGVRRAVQEGADIAVLDDAFQHRGIRTDAAVVLFAAEESLDAPRLLPRGPWREPLAALERATLAVVTRKVASYGEARAMAKRLAELPPVLPQAQAYIRLCGLAPYRGASAALGDPVPLEGFESNLAVAGVARPEAFKRQLEKAGVRVGRFHAFPDHHRFSARDLQRIVANAGGLPVIATLKDAVKLIRSLAGRAELYVALQEIVWEEGVENIECLLSNLSDRATVEGGAS